MVLIMADIRFPLPICDPGSHFYVIPVPAFRLFLARFPPAAAGRWTFRPDRAVKLGVGIPNRYLKGNTNRGCMQYRKLWIAFGLVMVVSFAVLGIFGKEIYRQAPPIPGKTVDSEGKLLFTGQDIKDGQNVWQSMGGQEVGTIWGHGAYVAPDWSADWLHREALFMLEGWAQREAGKPFAELGSEVQAGLRARLQKPREPLGEFGRRHRMREIEALHRATAERLEALPLFLGLDAFGDRRQREAMRELEDRIDDGDRAQRIG